MPKVDFLYIALFFLLLPLEASDNALALEIEVYVCAFFIATLGIAHEQGWVDELIDDIDELVSRVKKATTGKETVSIAYEGNVVEVWEAFEREGIYVDLGSDQTSLHNPWAGGYYPVQLGFEEANEMMANDPDKFHACL